MRGEEGWKFVQGRQLKELDSRFPTSLGGEASAPMGWHSGENRPLWGEPPLGSGCGIVLLAPHLAREVS